MPGKWMIFTQPFDWRPRQRVMVSIQPGSRFVVNKLAEAAEAAGVARPATEEETSKARAARGAIGEGIEVAEPVKVTEPAELVGEMPKASSPMSNSSAKKAAAKVTKG